MKRKEIRRNRSRITGWRGRWVCSLSILAIGLAPAAAFADSKGIAKEAGIGAGSAVTTLVYAPLKLVYALGGLVIGGFAWAFSGGDSEVASSVLTPSLRGTYVLSPEHLSGEREIEFFGRDPQYRDDVAWEDSDPGPNVAAAPPERW